MRPEKNKSFIIFVFDDITNTNWKFYEEQLHIKFRFLDNYSDTEYAIEHNLDNIVTTSIGHISFDLIGLGYDIFVFNQDIQKQFYPGMDSEATKKDIRFGHNIFKLLHAGVFNDDFTIDHSLREFDEYIGYKQPKIIEDIQNIVRKTLGYVDGIGHPGRIMTDDWKQGYDNYLNKNNKFNKQMIDISFEDKEDSSIMHFMREWMHMYNGNKTNQEPDKDIEELIENNEYVDLVKDKKTGQIGKLFTTGIKDNGKFDLGIVFNDKNKKILKDCSLV